MTRFIILAAIMAVLAAAVVAVPLLRQPRARWVAVIAALFVAGAAAGLYPLWSNYPWAAVQAAAGGAGSGGPDVGAMVAKLEAHLREHAEDQKGWLMLGHSYSALERPDDALQAYQHAYALGKSADAALGMGEALSMQAGGDISAQAAAFFEEGLQLEPANPKGLLYGGLAAEERGDKTLARARWQALKDLDPPPQIVQLIDARLASLDRDVPQGTTPSSAGTNAGTPDKTEAHIAVKITIAAALMPRLKADIPLFLFAREPGESRGPPLAVKRLTGAAVGTTVDLSSQDSMMAGRAIHAGQRVSVSARLSFSGQPLPASGDLYGETSVQVGSGGVAEILIDRIAE